MQVVANGTVYQIDPKSYPTKAQHGHSGREFVINFKDGRTVTTDNLWYNGIVTDRFRDRLPNNATIEDSEPIIIDFD